MSISIPPKLESGTLCQDAMVEVFLRSPIKSLKRFLFVSNNWGDFLTHPNFNQLYMKKNPRRQDLVFPARNGRRELVVLKKTHPPVGAFSVHNLPLECKDKVLVGSCVGLVCFSRVKNGNGKKGFIWNPATKVGKLFDFPPLLPTEFEVSGFGFDVKNQDYKVVRLVGCKSESRIQVYSSRQDSWRDIRTVPFSTIENSNFVMEGVPYWVGTHTREGAGQTSVIFSFNPTTEHHNQISLPAVDQSKFVHVVYSGYDILALAHSRNDDHTVEGYRFHNGIWVHIFRTRPLDNLYGESIIQYFRKSIVTWALPYNTSLYDVEKEEVLPISSMIHRLIPRMDESFLYLETLVAVTGGQAFYPTSVGEVFRDFKGRRAALIKALTIDAEIFYKQCEDAEEIYMQCDPAAGEIICLYGLTNEEWEIRLRGVQVSVGIPEPGRGIYFAQKAMEENVWLSFVAARCDEWLLSVAFYIGAQFGFDKDDRNRLFSLINDLPTVYEVVRAAPKKQLKNVLQQQ